MKKLKFTELSLSAEIMKAVTEMGFEEATPIQSLAIPVLLTGKDVIGQAQTGTGKTAAFGIPILETVDPKIKAPQAIILCPTRELAIQVAEELNTLAKHKRGIAILPVYGGQPIDRQIHALKKGVHIVIGTPGRVIDHLERRTLKLETVRMVVLDEADEMLDMGFRDDIEIILKSVPAERQTVFFSATMPKAFMALTTKYQKHPQHIKVVHEKISAPDIDQIYFEVRENMKLETLCRIIDVRSLTLSLVFCNTKRKVDEVVSHLQARGYSAEGIHGDLNQHQRDRVMAKFRQGTLEVLVATDVAARGIDVDDIQAVFNYDVPQDEENYVHRIGRTGRAGRSGHAFTFAAGRDLYKLRDIQRYIKVQIKRQQVPSLKDVEEMRLNQFMDQVRQTLQESNDLDHYSTLIERLTGNEYSGLDAAAALLKMALQQQSSPRTAEPASAPQAGTLSAAGNAAQGGMARLFIKLGKKDNVRPGDILGALAGETGIEGHLIGNIDIHDAFTFVDVPAAYADQIMAIMSKRFIRGHKVIIGPALQEQEKRHSTARR